MTQGQRPREQLLADAIGVLTEAARLRRPVLEQVASDQRRPAPAHTEQADWAEFVVQALAGAAANIGGVEDALAGRPDSWEADGVRSLLHAAVGHDEAHLHEHRTEPIKVMASVEEILADLGIEGRYDAQQDALIEAEAEALAQIEDDRQYVWYYERTETGEFLSPDPSAPPWSVEAWRADQQAHGASPAQIAQIEATLLVSPLVIGVNVAKSAQARIDLQRIHAQHAAVEDDFARRYEALADRRSAARAAYGQALAASVRDRAASIYPGIAVEIETDRTLDGPDTYPEQLRGPQARLMEYAREHTPLPGGPAPRASHVP